MPVNAPRVALVLTRQDVRLVSVAVGKTQDHVRPFMHPFVAMETNFPASATPTRLDILLINAVEALVEHLAPPYMHLFVVMAMNFPVNVTPMQPDMLPTNAQPEGVQLPVRPFMILCAATTLLNFRVNAMQMVQGSLPTNVVVEHVLHNVPLFEIQFVATARNISINVEPRQLAWVLVSVQLDSVDPIVLRMAETPCVVKAMIIPTSVRPRPRALALVSAQLVVAVAPLVPQCMLPCVAVWHGNTTINAWRGLLDLRTINVWLARAIKRCKCFSSPFMYSQTPCLFSVSPVLRLRFPSHNECHNISYL